MRAEDVKNLLKRERALRLLPVDNTAQCAAFMRLKHKISGSLLAVVGFMLSPLSWWNDAVVNLPLAVAFAWLVSLPVVKPWKETVFDVAVILGYWLTNVLGLVLMHKGAGQLLSREAARGTLKKDLIVSLAYTAAIVWLIKFGVLKPV